MSAADDLVAHLLLKKLKLAAKLDHDSAAPVVRMNSVVEYRQGDTAIRWGRLVHPSARVQHGISICSLLGAGLVGLSEGQSILWPEEAGVFRPLTIVRIDGASAVHRFSSFGKKES